MEGDQRSETDTHQKEPVTLPESERNTDIQIQPGREASEGIKLKFRKKYDINIRGPRFVVDEISPDDIFRKREEKIYGTRQT